MYKVDISPAANSVLEEYTFRCARDNGRGVHYDYWMLMMRRSHIWNPLPPHRMCQIEVYSFQISCFKFLATPLVRLPDKECENCVKIDYN